MRSKGTRDKRQVSSEGVVHPKHYMGWPIEPITFIMVNNLPFAEGNVIKYVMRWKDKDGIKDLLKARRYIDMLIETATNLQDYLPKKGCL